MIVRDMLPAEAAEVGELRVAAYRAEDLLSVHPPYAEVLRRLGADGKGEILVAAPGDGPGAAAALLGTVMIEPWTPNSEVALGTHEVEVRALAVSPAARGRGVARALMAEVEERAAARGAGRVVLSTQPAMAAAQRLYASRGFTRLPDRDWSPIPGFTLLAYGKDL
ncbi:GNAT family N-acetyltransferase [Nocardiopsis composta]|uniref:Ribosomal protein S18 acetylase RimI-like enzyme n=1 Tax=Nocardiopsis composta TaxID=157465 RepID=A0A7W8QS53_9ACTN|nr:GNAT family N-acetyltransferase [Nocardiopsis composta]MBB5435529.1 ribosomal protein S18 acetylase RimI-like enzyme [Nocardiopsis composta]